MTVGIKIFAPLFALADGVFGKLGKQP